jgi:hypothetical protein
LQKLKFLLAQDNAEEEAVRLPAAVEEELMFLANRGTIMNAETNNVLLLLLLLLLMLHNNINPITTPQLNRIAENDADRRYLFWIRGE